MKKQELELDIDEVFSPASVEVVTAYKRKTTWHVVSHSVKQTRPDRSVVSLDDGQRLASCDSGVKALDAVAENATSRCAMAVLPPSEGSPLFTALCPTHGKVRNNSTIEYAAESAYWHALQEHD